MDCWYLVCVYRRVSSSENQYWNEVRMVTGFLFVFCYCYCRENDRQVSSTWHWILSLELFANHVIIIYEIRFFAVGTYLSGAWLHEQQSVYTVRGYSVCLSDCVDLRRHKTLYHDVELLCINYSVYNFGVWDRWSTADGIIFIASIHPFKIYFWGYIAHNNIMISKF